jgi:hypothetical protein
MTLPIPISAAFGSLLVDGYATYPATTVVRDCRNIHFEPVNLTKDYSGSSTGGFERRYAGAYDSRLSFDIYANDGASHPLKSHDLALWGAASGGVQAAIPDVVRITLEHANAVREYVSSSTAQTYRRIPGKRSFKMSWDALSQAGVCLASPAWVVAGAYADVTIKRGSTVGLAASIIIDRPNGDIRIEDEELVSLSVDAFNDNTLSGGVPIYPTGEVMTGFGHMPGEYISVVGMSSATKGLKGIFIIERITTVIDILGCKLVEQTIECLGDGTPGIEAVT